MPQIPDMQTPALLLDRGKLTRNVHRMHSHIASLGGVLRPHGKTIKSTSLWAEISDQHTKGVTVSTLLEAEYYFAAGVKDILYAVGIAPNKLTRAAALIAAGAELKLLLESSQQVKQVARAGVTEGIEFSILVEIDSDGHRAGLSPDAPQLLEIAQQARDLEGVKLIGVMTHAGASYRCESIAAIQSMAEQERLAVSTAANNLLAAGFSCPVVSMGSTPTAQYAQSLEGATEVRAGVYPFHDLVMAGLGVCQVDDIAISVLTSVIGYQSDRTLLIDAGWMALSRDRGTASQIQDQGYGLVCDDQGRIINDLMVTATSQEHGQIEDRQGRAIALDRYPIGTLLRVLPNHACATAAMHAEYFVLDQEQQICERWPRINGW